MTEKSPQVEEAADEIGAFIDRISEKHCPKVTIDALLICLARGFKTTGDPYETFLDFTLRLGNMVNGH